MATFTPLSSGFSIRQSGCEMVDLAWSDNHLEAVFKTDADAFVWDVHSWGDTYAGPGTAAAAALSAGGVLRAGDALAAGGVHLVQAELGFQDGGVVDEASDGAEGGGGVEEPDDIGFDRYVGLGGRGSGGLCQGVGYVGAGPVAENYLPAALCC